MPVDFTSSDVTTIGWEQLPAVASNFDHEWDDQVAGELQAKPNSAYAQYAGWNFCGYVWHDGHRFNCQVWTYRSIREVVSAVDGPTLMREISSRYGAD